MITDKDKLKLYKKAGDNAHLSRGEPRFDSRPKTIHTSCARGFKGDLKRLIMQGADVNVRNELGNTPLHMAVREGHEDIIRMLIEAGADPFFCNTDGENPVDWARALNKEEFVRILIGPSLRKAFLATAEKTKQVFDEMLFEAGAR